MGPAAIVPHSAPRQQLIPVKTALVRALWSGLGAAAVLWPARLIGPLDGAPLDSPLEAIIIGLALPALWWLDRRAVDAAWARAAIVLLLAWKIGTGALLAQQGLCAATFAPGPIDGINQGIPIQEPSGALRSWDLRAEMWSPVPACTAILTRPLPTQEAFPAWHLNVTDQIFRTRDFRMTVRGYFTTTQEQVFTAIVDRDVRLSGAIDGQLLDGQPYALMPGPHAMDLVLALTGNAWRFEPMLDGRPLWDLASTTTRPAGRADRLVASWGWGVPVLIILGLVAGLTLRMVARLKPSTLMLLWAVGGSAAAAILGLLPYPGLHRAAGLAGIAALLVPVPPRLRNVRGAFLLVGLPWLTFFAAWSLHQVGHFSVYSVDDWLTYQVAGYRIFMHGYWLEGGNAVFDFQPLYRWMTGALHLVFGDSSVGEVYWDATCLLIGALLAFQLARVTAGFRWGLAAAVATLATFTLGTPWYFLGRGLSEIAAAGWAFLAIFFLLRARRGRLTWAVAASVSAVLMFYTRLNHLLFAGFLIAACLTVRTPATVSAIAQAIPRVRKAAVAIFLGGFASGVLFFMWRTWHYTGVFSLFYGTSLKVNDTGLRPWTLLNGEVWGKVGHSLANLVLMNEPPHLDPRTVVMMVGAAVAVFAFVQAPVARRVPATVVILALGGSVSALFAHAHGYPGRFSIHLVPFAAALAATFAASVLSRRSVRS